VVSVNKEETSNGVSLLVKFEKENCELGNKYVFES
jgi:hypothetical protein